MVRAKEKATEHERVLADAKLSSVNLVSFNGKFIDMPKTDYSLTLKCTVQHHHLDAALFCETAFNLTCLNAEDKDLCTVEAIYLIVYQLNEEQYDGVALRQFAERNSVFNAFPFFRELADNFSRRTPLQLPQLPLLKPDAIDSALTEGISVRFALS